MWCLCILFLVTTLLISHELSPDWKTVYRFNKVCIISSVWLI
nr:MAG TPA: hypothetical protein [Caudoviricetes sp.]